MPKYVAIPGRLAVAPEELAVYQAADEATEITIKANIDALAAEVARALAAEEVVGGNVEAEVARATAAEGGIANALDAETDRALAAEAAVAAALSAETTRAQDSEDAITDALVAETNRALAAEAVMATHLVAGRMSAADKTKLDSYPATPVGGGAGHTGTVAINFGDVETREQQVVTVLASWVSGASFIDAMVVGVSPDHPSTQDDVWLEEMRCFTNNIVPGVSFDIVVVPATSTWGRYEIIYYSSN